MFTPIAITFLINAATQILKRFVIPRFGEIGVHVILFVLSLAGAAYFMWLKDIPGIQNALLIAVQFFCLGIAIYEVFLKKLGFVSQLFASSSDKETV